MVFRMIAANPLPIFLLYCSPMADRQHLICSPPEKVFPVQHITKSSLLKGTGLGFLENNLNCCPLKNGNQFCRYCTIGTQQSERHIQILVATI
jgi:hypothetical protein